MRVTVNLATRPYVELDRIFRQLRVAIAVLAVTAIAMVFWLHARTAQAREQQREVEAVQARTAALQTERTRNEARMRQPQNAAVLQQVEFLNALFQRKSFSWTAVLMDLEEVLPSGVQVTSIDPQTASNGEVSIRLRVSGQRDRVVVFVRNLEGSHRFIAPRLVSEAQQQQEKGSGIKVPAAYLANGAVPQNGADPQALYDVSGTNGAALGPSPVDFDVIAGYNPLQPTVRERVSRHKPSPASNADDSTPGKGAAE